MAGVRFTHGGCREVPVARWGGEEGVKIMGLALVSRVGCEGRWIGRLVRPTTAVTVYEASI